MTFTKIKRQLDYIESTTDAEEFLYSPKQMTLCKLNENIFNYVKYDLETLNAIISKRCFLKKVIAMAKIFQKILD